MHKQTNTKIITTNEKIKTLKERVKILNEKVKHRDIKLKKLNSLNRDLLRRIKIAEDLLEPFKKSVNKLTAEKSKWMRKNKPLTHNTK